MRRTANRRRFPGKVVFHSAIFLLIVLNIFVTSSGLFGNVLLSETHKTTTLHGKLAFCNFLSTDSVHRRTALMQQLKWREADGGLWDFPHCKQKLLQQADPALLWPTQTTLSAFVSKALYQASDLEIMCYCFQKVHLLPCALPTWQCCEMVVSYNLTSLPALLVMVDFSGTALGEQEK